MPANSSLVWEIPLLADCVRTESCGCPDGSATEVADGVAVAAGEGDGLEIAEPVVITLLPAVS